MSIYRTVVKAKIGFGGIFVDFFSYCLNVYIDIYVKRIALDTSRKLLPDQNSVVSLLSFRIENVPKG